ncbi:MAG TPA: hypothetical protein DCM62_10575 [Bacteroidales bacterium]|nr:hypothetical protein [Bacteroidales bacterium]
MKKFLLLTISILCGFTAHSQTHFKEVQHYLFQEFTVGTVHLMNGETTRALLNYNLLTEEMVFANRGQMQAISEEYANRIAQIVIADRTFFMHEGNFVELLYSNGIRLYADYKARINDPGSAAGYGMRSQTAVSSRYLRLHFETAVYNLELPEDLVPIPFTHYWLKKNGRYHEVSNISQFRRIYPNRRDALREFQNANTIDFNDPATILRLVKHLEGVE